MEIILCPTDFSTRADTAVFFADELARRMNTFFLYFHIIYKPSAPQMVSKDDGPKTSWRVHLPHIAAGLSRFCRHHPAGILVMGFHPPLLAAPVHPGLYPAVGRPPKSDVADHSG